MKIIAGKLGGRKIKTLDSYDTRPTSAKIRGAIFNALGQYFLEGNVLDLFSGSGAMAIEALSRGCTHAVCIDKNRLAYQVIRENCAQLNIAHLVDVRCCDYQGYLNRISEKFDLVFIDPPYKMKIIEDVVEQLFTKNLLNIRAKIIVEFSNKIYTEEELAFLSKYHVVFNRRYDATQIVIIEHNGERGNDYE